MSNQYHKVFDGGKRRIRGLWRRNDLFYAQASLPDDSGVVKVRRGRLTATTVAGAAAELRRLTTRREEEQLPLMTQAPKFDSSPARRRHELAQQFSRLRVPNQYPTIVAAGGQSVAGRVMCQ